MDGSHVFAMAWMYEGLSGLHDLLRRDALEAEPCRARRVGAGRQARQGGGELLERTAPLERAGRDERPAREGLLPIARRHRREATGIGGAALQARAGDKAHAVAGLAAPDEAARGSPRR